MRPDEPFIVYPNRSRLARLAVTSLVFVAGGSWLVFGHPNASWPFGDPHLVKVVGWLEIVFSGGIGGWVTWRLMSRRPLLAISTQGFEDHASLFSAGFLSWDQVAQLRVWTYRSPMGRRADQEFLALDLMDPQAFQATRSRVRRTLGRMKRSGDAPLVAIPLAFLPADVDLQRLLREIRQRSDVAFAPDLAAMMLDPGRPDI